MKDSMMNMEDDGKGKGMKKVFPTSRKVLLRKPMIGGQMMDVGRQAGVEKFVAEGSLINGGNRQKDRPACYLWNLRKRLW